MTQSDFLKLHYAKDVFLMQDVICFLCGNQIGAGQYRDVFEYNLDPKLVVKIQREAADFSNVIEFQIWCDVRHGEYGKFFAGCPWISGNGRIMLQQKTQPITAKRRPPERIPSFFTDIKESNFGFIGKQFVAHDYDFSMTKFISKGLTKDTKKWRSHIDSEK